MLPCSRVFGLFAAAITFNPAPAETPAARSARSDYTLETGTLDHGAKFAVALPTHWNRRILLLAHARRAAERPLVADLNLEHLARKTFLDEGWIIATTSFRRNGIVLADAITDLDALRAHIIQKFGAAERVLLEGDEMGGLIVTLMAEREPAEPKLYDAALAVGATFQLREPGSSLGLTLQPKIPLLILANQSGLEAFRHYVEATTLLDEPTLRPVLYRIARDGHANVNQRERLLALRALNLWLDHGRGALPLPPRGETHLDITIPPDPQPSQVALHADRRGFDARVLAISIETGDLTLNAQPADFGTIGLGKTARFQITAHGQTYRATYARGSERDLKRGDWIAFATADGFFFLACYREDAAASARVSVGDTITIRRFDSGR